MFNKLFRKSCRLLYNVEKFGRARQAIEGDTARALGMLGNEVFTHTHTHTHTLRTNNTYCFSKAEMVMRTRFYVTFVRSLSALLTIPFFVRGSGG
jgi:hypothetical protein